MQECFEFIYDRYSLTLQDRVALYLLHGKVLIFEQKSLHRVLTRDQNQNCLNSWIVHRNSFLVNYG